MKSGKAPNIPNITTELKVLLLLLLLVVVVVVVVVPGKTDPQKTISKH
jgi:hypothetical protein